MLAVIRVRGNVKLRQDIKDTLKILKLHKINHLVLLDANKYDGMLTKVKSYITWGEINKETLIKLLKKRGRITGNKRIEEKYLKEKKLNSFDGLAEKMLKDLKIIRGSGIKEVFRLGPPKKGYERKGIKKDFRIGGALGYRGEKINELIGRMI